MKEIYDWVPWFQELAGKIADGGEAYLVERAKRVDWANDDPALLKFGDENIDPFSFFYFLARKNIGKKGERFFSRKRVFLSVHKEFGISSEFPNAENEEQLMFPTPPALAGPLFHNGVHVGKESLWELFRQAITDADGIDADNFKAVLDIQGVGVQKLTQCLCLINPDYFVPMDRKTLKFYEGFDLPPYQEVAEQIKLQNGWGYYKNLIKKFRDTFPECRPYEVNTALYAMANWESHGVAICKNFFQVSAYVYGHGPKKREYWEDFSTNNCVYTGGPGGGLGGWGTYDPNQNVQPGRKPYPLNAPQTGDIIFVRVGVTEGRGVGIVYKNDYADKGLSADSVIHVFWLNKTPTKLAGQVTRHGFSAAPYNSHSYNVFANTDAYKPTFKLIQHIREKQGILQDTDTPEDDHVHDDSSNYGNQMNTPLNQILYGPPGTGKTWNTVNHALAIIEGKDVAQLEKENRGAVKQRFDEFKESGQIEMVTFHQNFQYEDFIEGIKPKMEDNDSLQYEIVDGIFKEIAIRARKNLERLESAAGAPDASAGLQAGPPQQLEFTTESFNVGVLLQDFARYINDSIGRGETIEVFRGDKSIAHIVRAKTLNSGKIRFVLAVGEKRRRWGVSSNMILRDFREYSAGKITSYKQIKPAHKSAQTWHGDGVYLFDLMKQMEAYRKDKWQPEQRLTEKKQNKEKRQPEQRPAEKRQNYVLIIDEINRGNIAKIFGELITLIEPSKRLGGPDAASVTLPYSGGGDDAEEFGVPDNLYIIGTMNTADRSIALLDTALRRRFDFIEMMPDPDHSNISKNIKGVDCQKMLSVMNKRITALLDREHQIGHSYLIGVDSMEKLAGVFQNQIIPLLQEYFYDDWAKIDLVLNKNKFVTATDVESGLFSDTDLVNTDRKIYELIGATRPEWTDPASYRKIYATRQTEADTTDGE